MWIATGARPHLRARMEAGTISRRGKHFALGGLPQVAAGLYIACRPE